MAHIQDMRNYIEITEQVDSSIGQDSETIGFVLEPNSQYHYFEYPNDNYAWDVHQWLLNNHQVWNELLNNVIKLSTDDILYIDFNDYPPTAVYSDNNYNCQNKEPSILDDLKTLVQQWQMYRDTDISQEFAHIAEEVYLKASVELEQIIRKYEG